MKKWQLYGALGLITLSLIVILLNHLAYVARNKRETFSGLRQIYTALSSYHDFAGRYPHHEVSFGEKHLGSWRYMLLHWLQGNSQTEHDLIVTTPWSQTHFAQTNISFYCIDDHETREGFPSTNILAVIGPNTAFESSQYKCHNSILLMAVGDTETPWGMVGDIKIDTNGDLTSDLPPPLYNKWYGVLLDNGDMYLLDGSIPPDKIEPFLIKNTLDPETEWSDYIIEKFRIAQP